MMTISSNLRYDAVLFDVGGTLIGFHDRESFRDFLEHVDLPAGESEAHAASASLPSCAEERTFLRECGCVGLPRRSVPSSRYS